MNTTDGVRVLIGVAALGWVGRETIKNRRRPKVLGVTLPRDLDTHKLAKQIGKVADQLERTSEDVRIISGQAKRLSKKLA
jgi:hypothetical protein